MPGGNIIIALDRMSEKEALELARMLSGKVWGFKVTDLLFEGVHIISQLKEFGNVFADAKLHDIPETVANSVKKLSMAGADMITVHVSGGVDMIRAAKVNAKSSKIIGVTVLTSFDEETASNIFGQSIEETVSRFVQYVYDAGADGVVSSCDELSLIKNMKESKSLLTIAPGIRPTWFNKTDDQKRRATPKEAITLGADYIVIGRPITKSSNVIEALERIIDEIR